MNNFFKRHKYYIFLVLLLIVYLILDYHSILFYRPQGLHFIRQTDSLSFVTNYVRNGFSFFEPQVYNLSSVDGKSACEFPILYYLTSILYWIFGEHEFILRLITLIIVSFGFFSLFKLLFLLLGDLFYAFVFSFLFLSSTVLLYYTNNFLPDASALGFTFAGWYYFYCFFNKLKSKRYLSTSFLFFTLGSLLKATYFINPIAAMLTVLVYDFFAKYKIIATFKTNWFVLLAFIASSLVVASWNFYAYYYKITNHDYYFIFGARPIWKLSRERILEVWDFMSRFWFSEYYFQSTIHFFTIVFIVGMLFIKKSNRVILIPSVLLMIGSLFYWLLFFVKFIDHDYYFIAFIPSIIFIVINSFITIKNRYPRIINSYAVRILILSLNVLSINYARIKVEHRYNSSEDSYSKIGTILNHTREYIDSLGICKDAKIIVFTDKTRNGGLYFLDRKGWSIKDSTVKNIEKIDEYKTRGAQYLINTTTMHFDYQKVGTHNAVSIYSLY